MFWESLWESTLRRTGQFRFSLWDKTYLRDLFKDNFASKDRLNILDVGCGANGNFKTFFKNPAGRMVNFDLSYLALSELRKQVETGRIPINSKSDFVQGTLLKLPFKHNFFDLVICCQCLNYFYSDERRIVLDGIFRVCKEGGHVIIAVKNRYSLQALFRKVPFSVTAGIPFYPFTYKELQREVRQGKIIDIFGNFKIPLISPSSKWNVFPNKYYKRSWVAKIFPMDFVLFAKKANSTA